MTKSESIFCLFNTLLTLGTCFFLGYEFRGLKLNFKRNKRKRASIPKLKTLSHR